MTLTVNGVTLITALHSPSDIDAMILLLSLCFISILNNSHRQMTTSNTNKLFLQVAHLENPWTQ